MKPPPDRVRGFLDALAEAVANDLARELATEQTNTAGSSDDHATRAPAVEDRLDERRAG